jgi:hypothetical protein
LQLFKRGSGLLDKGVLLLGLWKIQHQIFAAYQQCLHTLNMFTTRMLYGVDILDVLCVLPAAALVMILLEDLMDNSAVVHCPDIFAWLEVHTYLFRPTAQQAQQLFNGKGSPFETTFNKNNLLRLCNTLLKRLSKSSDALLAARVLIFMANFFPLLTERSGLNIPVTLGGRPRMPKGLPDVEN